MTNNNKREELFKNHKEICEIAFELMKKKNHDYAYGDDPYANFKKTEYFNLASTESGIVIRILDKISRISTFINSGTLKTDNESFTDAVVDVINYMVLLHSYLKDKKNV